MGKIHSLPPHIIAKIAAGEVIERPAFAVKELIENALDANAYSINIEIEESGLRKIAITDTGEGMTPEDVLESFKPHTTSKISDDHLLIGISSFGFRGEALNSIAAVSTLTIQSRIKNAAGGHSITVEEGKLIANEPVGMPYGTSIVIQNLFASVPSRKKFLKSPQTEFRHIVDIVFHYSIAFPHIRFFLSHNKRIVLDLPAKQDVTTRINTLLGTNTVRHYFPITYNDSYVSFSGFLALPTLTTQSQQKQLLFVNGRYVNDKTISLAVKESYGTMLDPTSYPLFILFLNVPYEFVDVNIHPRKEQVSFVDNTFIFDAIKKGVLETLSKQNLSFANVSWKEDQILQKGVLKGIGSTKSFAGKLLKNIGIATNLGNITKEQVLQIHNLYLLVQTKEGVMIIDQHAAHERVLYEEFSKAFKEHKNKIYKLKKPITVEISFSDKQIVQEYEQSLLDLGFNFDLAREQSNNETIQVISIPYLLKDRNVQTLVTELIDDLRENQTIKTIDIQSHRMLSYLACRAAAKAGDPLTQKQSKQLLEDLEKTPNNLTCPHGRPTRIEVSLGELNGIFRRK